MPQLISIARCVLLMQLIGIRCIYPKMYTPVWQFYRYSQLPFVYYKLHITSDVIKRIQFPMPHFEQYNAHKHKQALLTTLKKNIPTNLSIFISQQSFVLHYAYLLWYAMQTNSNREDQILKCVYKMIIYKFKLAPINSSHLFNPDLESFLTFTSKKPQVALSNTSRNLIHENYEFLNLKYDLLNEGTGSQKQNLQGVINELKKNRRRKRNYESGDIKYKFLQGTGTQIKYDMKLGYFFEDGMASQ